MDDAATSSGRNSGEGAPAPVVDARDSDKEARKGMLALRRALNEGWEIPSVVYKAVPRQLSIMAADPARKDEVRIMAMYLLRDLERDRNSVAIALDKMERLEAGEATDRIELSDPDVVAAANEILARCRDVSASAGLGPAAVVPLALLPEASARVSPARPRSGGLRDFDVDNPPPRGVSGVEVAEADSSDPIARPVDAGGDGSSGGGHSGGLGGARNAASSATETKPGGRADGSKGPQDDLGDPLADALREPPPAKRRRRNRGGADY